jgi:type VI secretion system secreted protein Hcp
MFLRITTIAGESVDASHPGDIDILSFAWGVSSTTTATTTGTSNAQSLQVVKRTDKASPKLMLGTFSGTHYATVTLFVRSRATTPLEFLKITLTDVVIQSYQLSANTTDSPTESFSIGFRTIKMDYTPLKADGTPDTVVSNGWNIATNAAF